jgi:lysine/ornithine N-monooxygenase
MKTEIAIIGCGPRGLGLALAAKVLYPKANISIIDPNPLKVWTKEILPDIQMRSPASFDLTTNNPYLYQYSLINYLNLPKQTFNNYKDLERYPYFITRKEFSKYLNYIFKDVLSHPNIRYIPLSINKVVDNEISFKESKEIIKADNIVFTMGSEYAINNVPMFIKLGKTPYYFPNQINGLKVGYNSSIGVIGSGQNAFELAVYFSKRAAVTLINKSRKIKVNPYPVPTWADWKEQSVFSDYYNYLPINEKREYINRVKKWGPTITPYIYNQFTKQNIRTCYIEDIDKEIGSIKGIDFWIISTGFINILETLPIENVAGLSRNPVMPSLFKTETGINKYKIDDRPYYISGTLAIGADGPRQGSLYSIGQTSSTILKSILE